MGRIRAIHCAFSMLFAVAGGVSTSAHGAILTTLTDRCSQSVWLSPDYSAGVVNPPGAVFLNRLEATPFTAWSTIIRVKRFGPDHYVRWFCSMTKERSRCPAGTTKIQGRLGPNRLLQIRCRN